MWIAVLVIILAVGIGVAVGLSQKKAADQLLASGRIVKRGSDWLENAEEFTLTGADFPRVIQAVQKADFSGTGVSATKSDARQAIGFKSGTWQAEVYKKENVGDKDAYYFHFLKWQTHNGVPENILQMNILLTTVEKIFLEIDPNAQVRSTPIKVTTKTKFF